MKLLLIIGLGLLVCFSTAEDNIIAKLSKPENTSLAISDNTTTSSNSSIPYKFAYATIHYEGTPRDDEYLLGVRVLIKSLQLSGTKHDIVVIVPHSVSSVTKKILQKDGAILHEVEGIKNPYKDHADRRGTFQDRFDGTLNKIHVWNLTQYERVIYLDADNVIVDSLDELFMCGHFCAVFMNVAVFHTGLLVAKPNNTVFQDMLKKLESGTESYDGADQGFFVSYFDQFLFAPLFLGPVTQMSNDEMNRLPVNYNLNHIYYYEKSSWHFYRRFNFANKRIPASTIAYPIAPNWKPWYWWPYIWLSIHYEWHNVRVHVQEDFNVVKWIPLLALCASAISFELLNGYTLLTFWKRYQLHRFTQHAGMKWILVILWFFLSTMITFKSIPPTVYPSTGLWLFIVTQTFLFYSLFHKITHTTRQTRAKMLIGTMVILRVLAYLNSLSVSLSYRILIWLFGFQGFALTEFSFLYYYCFRSYEHFLSANGYPTVSGGILSLSYSTKDGDHLRRDKSATIHHCHSSDYSSTEGETFESHVVSTKGIAV